MKLLLFVATFLLIYSCGETWVPHLDDNEYTIENTEEEKVEVEQYGDSDFFSINILDTFPNIEEFTDKTFADNNGNYYYTRSTSNTDKSKYLIKLDHDGNTLWEKKFLSTSGNSSIYAYAIIEPSKSIVIAGKANDRFITKISSDGDQIWIKYFKDDEEDYSIITSVAVDSKENIYVSGYIENGYLDLADGFLRKFDKDGNLKWFKKSDMKYTDIYSNVVVDSNDNIYLTGTENMNHEYMIEGANFGTSMFVAKWNSDGKKIWKKTSRHENEVIYGQSLDISGEELIFLGERCEGVEEITNDSGDNEFDDHEVSDSDEITNKICYFHPFLRKYDLDGNKIWEKRWRGKENQDSVTSTSNVRIINDKIYTVLNAWDQFGTNSDIMISVFNKNGSHYITQIVESDCQDYPGNISKGLDNNLILTGWSDGWIGEDIYTAQCETESFKPFIILLKPKEQ